MPFSGLTPSAAAAGAGASVPAGCSASAGCSVPAVASPGVPADFNAMAGLMAQNQHSRPERISTASTISTPTQPSFFSLKAVFFRITSRTTLSTMAFSRATRPYQ